MNLHFTNLDVSPMQFGETPNDIALRKRIESEYSEQCREVGRQFREALTAAWSEVMDDGCYGTAAETVLSSMNRYVYLKNYSDNCDVEIDLLFRTFCKRYF